jgi:integrase/recombinase XerD
MDATLDTRFQQFLRERRYLRNVSPQTIEWYVTAWGSFKKSATHCPACPTCPADLKQAHLEEFVYALRDRGVRPVTVNTWLKALNTFFGWLHERGDLATKIRLKPLKVEKRLVPTINADAIRAIVTYKPPTWITVNKKHVNGPRKGQKAFALWRVHALACTLLDTGCRIDELLTALTTSFEQDDLLLTVIGKGDKQRRVPFSTELRRVLFRYLQTRERLGITDPLMFPSDGGGEWNQRNALRSFYLFQKRLGLPRVGFHRLRHTFATEYLRNGGDVVRLSRTLGHTQITTTRRYVQMLTGDLQVAHVRCSPLARVRG